MICQNCSCQSAYAQLAIDARRSKHPFAVLEGCQNTPHNGRQETQHECDMLPIVRYMRAERSYLIHS